MSLRGYTPPPILCRPIGAYILGGTSLTGVNTPAYVLAPYGLQNYQLGFRRRSRIKSGMRGIKSAHRGAQGFSKCQRSKSNYSWCNPPTYALTSKGVTKCLRTLWKGLIPITKLQHRRRPMSGYIRLCKVIYGYVRLCKVICGYGALVE